MDDKITIICPVCGAVLSVKNVPGIEKTHITCPLCKQKMPFTSYRRLGDDSTQYAGAGLAGPGSLVDRATGAVYPLREGRNVVGRKSAGSKADVQIECPACRTSREHLVIEVKETAGGGFEHTAKLYKEQVNATSIGGSRMSYGDCVVLDDGCAIKLPDVTLIFKAR